MLTINHLLSPIKATSHREVFQTSLQNSAFRLEHIISYGQASAEGFWYDQEENEWVLLLQGTATLQFSDGRKRRLETGDALLIPAHYKHRVAAVSDDAVWLALHFAQEVTTDA